MLFQAKFQIRFKRKMKPITISFFSVVLLVGSVSLLSKNEANDPENPRNLFILF
jgi:hypothetical protein